MRERVGCYDCGLPYGEPGWIEAIIPNSIWDEISPTKNSGGILCITCIARRCHERGLKNVPVWLCGTEPLIAMAGEPMIEEKEKEDGFRPDNL
jgi:hypothetical protein